MQTPYFENASKTRKWPYLEQKVKNATFEGTLFRIWPFSGFKPENSECHKMAISRPNGWKWKIGSNFKPIQEMKVSLFFLFYHYWPRYGRFVHLSVTPIAWWKNTGDKFIWGVFVTKISNWCQKVTKESEIRNVHVLAKWLKIGTFSNIKTSNI